MRGVARSLLSGILAIVMTGSIVVAASADEAEPRLSEGTSQSFELPGGGDVKFQPSDNSADGATVDVQPIDVEGATATSPDGTVTAIGSGVSIVATTPGGENVERIEHKVVIEEATEDAPGYVSELTPGIELEFPVDAADLEGLDLSTLGVWSREDADDEWTWVPSAYDAERGVVVAQSDHLSEFTLMAAPSSTATDPSIPRIALDPDDNAGLALWNGQVRGELTYSYAVAVAVQEYFETVCLADVMITRNTANQFVDRDTRADRISNFDADIALTLAFNTFNENKATGIAEPWGLETNGGVVAWAASNSASTTFGNRFRGNVPDFTGRPSRRALNPPDNNLPYAELTGSAPVYAHAELLFLDHNYDWPVINQHLSWVTDAVITSLLEQIEATPGIECQVPVTYPEPPSGEELERVRQLGYNNYQRYGTDPVNLSTGNYVASEKVFSITGVGDQEIDLDLSYNALDGRAGPVGNGWNFAYSSRAQLYDNGAVMVTLADGRSVFFEADGAGGFVTPVGARSTLVGTEEAAVLTFGDRTTLEFAFDEDTGYGTLVRAVDRQGNEYSLTYGPLAEPAENEVTFPPLTSITDEAGQTVAVTSTPKGRITAFTHPDGRQWTLAYDAAGNLTSITDGANRTRAFAYNASGLLFEVTGADGVKELTNDYDPERRVVTQTDGAGYVRTIAYGADDATTLTDALGNVSRLEHNAAGQLVREVDPEGGATRTYYDANSNPVTSVDANGNTHTSTFDVYGRVQSYTNPLGETTSYTYNAAGDLTSISSAAPNGATATTTLVLNADGRAIETHLPDGSVTYATYNDHGDATSVTDANGNVTEFAYDARGNTVLTVDPLGGETSSTFDLANRLMSTTDARGATTTFVWNNADRVTSMTDALGNATTYAYNVNDSLLSETDALGRTTSYEYNVNLQVTALIRPDGSRYEYEYDAEHRLTKQINPDGTFRTIEYDGLGREVAKVDEAGQRWLTEYDAIGNAIEITDPQGDSTQVEYDAMSRAVKIINAEGGVRTVQYRPTGLVGVETDEEGFSTVFTYDVMGRMVGVAHPDGTYETRSHDANGNVFHATDQRGEVTTLEYDARNRTVSVTDPAGGEWLTEYDAESNPIREVDPRGAATTWDVDLLGRVTSMTDALGGTSTTSYNDVGEILATTDELGRTTSFTYDALGRMTVATQPDGTTVAFGYDAMGRNTSTTDPAGFVMTSVFDALGRAVSTTDAAGEVWLNEYDAHGALLATEDPLGARTTWEYDGLGRATSMTDAEGNQTSYGLDARGDMISATDPLGFVTLYTRDEMRRIEQVTNADGGVAVYEFDGAGNLSRMTDAEGHVATYAYDALGRQTTTVDAEGGAWSTQYDAVGNPVGELDPRGAATTWEYDLLGRVTTSTDALDGTTTTSYNAAGEALATTDPLGRTASFTYDVMGRMTSATQPDGTTVAFGYDALGRTTSSTDERGFVTSFAFDAVGRQVSTTDAAGQLWANEYDARGALVATEDPRGARTTWTYDAVGRAIATTDAEGNQTLYGLDARGDMVSATDARGFTTQFDRDSMGRVQQVTAADGGVTGYQFDLVGNVTRMTDAEGYVTTYAYDGLSRQTSTVDAEGGIWATEYDATGNPVAVTDATGARTESAYDLLARMTSTTNALGHATAAVYDAAGQLTERTDALGRATGYEYDAMGRVVSTTRPDGVTIAMDYNATGDLVSITNARGFVTSIEVDALGREVARVDAAGERWASEYDAAGNLTATVDPTGARSVTEYDLLSRPTATIDALGNRSEQSYDQVGAVASATDALGHVTTYTYDEVSRLATVTTSQGAQTALTYDLVGNRVSATDPLGARVTFSFDGLGREVARVAPDGGVTATTFDAVGRVTAVTDPNGFTKSVEYDAGGRVVAATDGEGFVTTYAYDAADNLVTETSPRGGVTEYIYDALDRQVSVTNAEGETVHTEFDAAGNAIAVVDEVGVESRRVFDPRDLLVLSIENFKVAPADHVTNVSTAIEYDARGLPVLVTDPRGNSTAYGLDALGRVITETDALGQVTHTAFDALGRVAETVDPDGGVTSMDYSPDGYLLEIAYPDQTVTYAYDAAGNRTGMDDNLGTSSWVFDWAGRAVVDTDAAGNLTEREFDLAGNQVSVEYGDGRVTERTFDGRGLAVTQTDDTGVTSFSFDADGGLTLVERASGVDTAVSRDLVGRVTSIVHSGEGVEGNPLPSGEVNPSSMAPGNAYGHCKDNGNGHPNQQPAGCDTGVLAFEYVYDERGLIEARDITTDETVTATDYAHDALGRLTESVTGEYTATYGWDAASNLVLESVSEDLATSKKNDGYVATRTVNEVNQLTRVVTDPSALPDSHTTTDLFVYDGRGNRVVETQVRGTGNSAKVESVVSYVFDGMDQVVGVTDWGKNLVKSHDDTVTVFERDGLGRALTVTEDGVTRERLFDGYQLVADGGTQMVRDPFGGVLAELDQVIEGHGSWATTVTRQQEVLTDVLGSSITVTTDGVIDADLRLFGDFGEVLTEPSWDTVTGFTGKVDTAGLTEFVTRSFDSGARVWVQDDVYRGEVTRASSMNRYTYVEGAPETYVDVLGFFRAAAALEAQRLAAAEAAWLSAVEAWKQSQPLCGGYYGCFRSKTFEQQYADASYAAARNTPSEQALKTYRQWYAEASYSQARNAWSDRAIETARAAYAEQSYQNARNTWSERAMRTYRQSIADRATLEAEYYQHQAAVEMQKTKVFENSFNFSTGVGVGVLEFAWDVVSFLPRLAIEEPVRFLADPGFYIEDFDNRRQERWDTVKDGWNMVTDIATRASVVQPMFLATFSGDASIGQVWDHVFEMGRDYVYGDTINAYHNADYYSVGKDVGYVAGEVALIVAPIPYVPRVPKVTVAKPATSLDDLATIVAQAGERSPLAPGGGLAVHETLGGHAIARHVGLTEAELLARMSAQPKLPAASSFLTRAEAEAIVAETVRVNESQIATWLASAPKAPQAFGLSPGTVPTGITVLPGASAAVPSYGARVVLVPDATSPLGYRILTAFPE